MQPPPVVSCGANWLVAAKVGMDLIALAVSLSLASDLLPHISHILLQRRQLITLILHPLLILFELLLKICIHIMEERR